MGVLWMGTPLVVMDVYEHALYIDYKNRKSDYIDRFMEHIDWQQVSRRFAEITRGLTHHQCFSSIPARNDIISAIVS